MKITKDNYFLFSGGEVHAKLDEVDTHITCLDYTMNGLMAVAQVKEILDRKGINASLFYPYFPYARQDRVINKNESFSLKVFCNFLNSLNFSSVSVVDPHSDVVGALVNNIKIIDQANFATIFMPSELFDDHDVIFVSPDAGAYKKLAKLMPNDYRIAIGTKIRSTEGAIVRMGVYAPVDLKGKTCVVVDDICDGGRTFIELGKILKHKGAAELHLYVTHGIFSNGLDELLKLYDTIYTTNSFDQSKYASIENLVVGTIC